jgi:KaiC/GvpD/RAD55 family RecA-like ATPase
MSQIPFGVSQLDSIIGGGAPPGNVVMLTGEFGAGAREFLYTTAVMNALYHRDSELFDLYYGDLHSDAEVPSEVHYISFTASESYLRREMNYTIDEEIVETAAPGINFRDFSPEYFQASPIPREWYVSETASVRDLGTSHSQKDLLSALGDYFSRHAADSLVVIDSLTDLVGAITDEMSWSNIAMVIKGLAKAAHRWGGMIVALVSEEALTDTQLGMLMESAGGTFRFTWETGGSQRARTMVVEEFRGVLSQLEEENIIRFEVEIHEAGLDVSDVRKIR